MIDRDKLERKAERAAGTLWRYATDKDTPMSERVKLLQWFVELGAGKARPMPERPAAPAGGFGVVLLPPVDDGGGDTYQFED